MIGIYVTAVSWLNDKTNGKQTRRKRQNLVTNTAAIYNA